MREVVFDRLKSERTYIGAEITANKEEALFVSPAVKKIKTLIADRRTRRYGGLDTYLRHRNTRKKRLVFCAPRFADVECILKVDVNYWN